MTIAILNYPCDCVDFIEDVPDMSDTEEIERWLEENDYDVSVIYYMCDADIEHFKVIDGKVKYIN